MDQVTVRMGEWFFTQSLIGFKKILENYGETVKTTHDGIIVEKRHLEVLTDAFFDYYLKQYSVARREKKAIRMLHKKFKEGDKTVKSDLNKRLNDTKKKVEKYFSETEEGAKLIEAVDLYRNEKQYHPEIDQWVNKFLEMLAVTEIDQKLTANYFRAVHLNPYFGQVSILNVTNNTKNIGEHKEIFYRDFVEPVLEEWKLYHALEYGNEKEVMDILGETTHKLLNPLKKGLRKKKTIKEMKEYIQQEIHKCSFTGFPLALHSFEEGVFVPLALSISNAINMTWDANGKELLPLSSLARLLIFCSQAGATMSQGKSVFVYYGGSFDEIYRTNQFYSDLKNPNKTFDEIVFDLVREQKLKADYYNNHYLIYEFTSDYQAKKTLLYYMVMTPNLLKLFSDHSDLFKNIHHTLKSSFIRLLLQGIDTKHFISEVLRNKIKNSYSTFEVIRMTQIRHLNHLYAKGDLKVDSSVQKRYVWALVKSAEKVKMKINNEKKAQGIAYRLLNAVRSNDKNTFMDTVMRTYISYDLEMPGLLLEALHEDKMDFATVGNAWIAGLVSKSKDLNEGDENDEQK